MVETYTRAVAVLRDLLEHGYNPTELANTFDRRARRASTRLKRAAIDIQESELAAIEDVITKAKKVHSQDA